jgi:hypothetical protein
VTTVAYHLGQIELVFLCVLLLCLAMLDTPVPRVLALPAAALVAMQTAALHALEVRPTSFADDAQPVGLSAFAAAVAVVVVPTLTVVLVPGARERAGPGAARPWGATCRRAGAQRPRRAPA